MNDDTGTLDAETLDAAGPDGDTAGSTEAEDPAREDGTVSDESDHLAALKSRKRLWQFISVGAVGVVFDVSMLLFLSQVVGVLEEIAVIAGIETAIIVMFFINDRWTFASHGKVGWWWILRRLGRSHAVRAAGFVTQFIVFVIIYRGLSTELLVFGLDTWLLVAKGAGVATGFTVNYVFETLYTWRAHR